VVDLTYVPITAGGFAYAAFVIDAFSRLIAGWQVAGHMRASLALDALEMAVSARLRAGQQVAGVIHHGDRGSQYLAIRYTARLAQAGAISSVGSKGQSYDNALAESIIGLFKAELIAHRGPWHTLTQVQAATAWWVGWYNNRRLYRPLGDIPPAEYEHNWLKDQQP
jgi:putative transposase